MTIYCSRCGAESPSILAHWSEVHGGVPQRKVKDYRVFLDEGESHPPTSFTPASSYMREYRAKNRDRINALRRERYNRNRKVAS